MVNLREKTTEIYDRRRELVDTVSRISWLY
jgi:hypothetical protein